MKEHIPPTVIKLPLDVTESSTPSRRIRLRNNIRLNLPPDQFSLLHSRRIYLLLVLYLAYTMYLHYLLYSHIATQDATNRQCSEEIARLQRHSSSDLAHNTNINDLKQSLRSFIHTLKSLKSSEDENSSDYNEDYSSLELRLSQDSFDTRLNEGFPEVPLLQDSFEVPPKALSKIPLSQEDQFENRSEVIFKWLDLPDVREQAGEVTPMSEMTSNGMDKMLSQDMTDADVANGTRTNEITLVLPHFEVEESKPRRARDVMSASPPSQVQVSILLKGATPTAAIRDGGVIRPWYLDARASGNLGNWDMSRHFVLQEQNGKVQIRRSGLYLVYAQIYYTTSEHITNSSDAINSYSVIVSSSPMSERPIAVCSVHASVNFSSEVSCHLSIVYHLSARERVYLVQREPNRNILLKEGYSYFGLSTLRIDD